MGGKRKLQKAHTREKIIAAAMKIYGKHGFSAPTSDIAGEAEIAHGSVFLHFPAVKKLIYALLDAFFQDVKKEIRFLSKAGTDIEKLLNMHIGVLIKYEDFYKRLISETVYLPKEAKSMLIAVQSTLSVHFLQILQPDIEAGKIKDIPFYMLFNTWLGLVHYYLLNAELFSPRGSVLKNRRKELVKCFMELIKRG